MLTQRRTALVVAAVVLPWSLGLFPSPSAAARAADAAGTLVARIVRADYEGDRAALKTLADEIAQLIGTAEREARLRYWRGFALMRRAQNGVNDGVPREQLLADFHDALQQFEASLAKDPAFEDATVTMLTCWQAIAFLNGQDPDRLREILPRLRQAIQNAEAVRADNPRRAWVLGAQTWYALPGTPPAEVERKQQAAIATYEAALPHARAQWAAARDPLEPSWGEPELLASLAWANLNRTTPDLAAAERYVRETLALVPHWHYARDILRPSIEAAKAKR